MKQSRGATIHDLGGIGAQRATAMSRRAFNTTSAAALAVPAIGFSTASEPVFQQRGYYTPRGSE
jgi:hypothetical protein